LRKELAAETEKNKDDIAHLQLLRKHFQEREEAYQVIFSHALVLSDIKITDHFTGSERSG